MNALHWFYSQDWHDIPARPVPVVTGISTEDEAAIVKLSRELASEGFDSRDVWADGWINDEWTEGNHGLLDLAKAVIDGDDESLRLARDRVREQYVSENAARYREKAERAILHPEMSDE